PAPATAPSLPSGEAAERSAVRVPPALVDDLVGRMGELVTAAGQVHALATALAGDAQHPAEEGRGALVRAAAAVARDVARVTEGLTTSVERLTLQPFADACAG